MSLQNILLNKLVEGSSIGKKIQSKNDVTKKGEFALDATEKNPNIEDTLAEKIANIEKETKQINNSLKEIIALPNGATTGDAQLEEAKVGIDGETYNTLGESIREQVKTYRDVSVSNNTPTNKAKVWVNTSSNSDTNKDILLPQIDDTTVSTDNTWSSSKITEEDNRVREEVDSKIDEVNDKVSEVNKDLDKQENKLDVVRNLFFDIDEKIYYDHASDNMLTSSAGRSGQIYILNDFVETNGKLTEVDINVDSDCNVKLYVFEQYDISSPAKARLSNIFDFNLKKGNNHISVNAVIPKKVRFGITGENKTVKYGNLDNGSIHWITSDINAWNTVGQTAAIALGGRTGDFSISLFGVKQNQIVKNLKGKTILLFGDSRSSSDYTWYKDLLEKKTGATVLNNGSSGANPKSMITSDYLNNMLNIEHDICIMFLCGNISGYKGTLGTFSYGSPLYTWGETVVNRWDGTEEFDVDIFNKPIQCIDYIVQKYNKKFYADRKHKLYILTDIPSKRKGEGHGYTMICNYGKSEMIKEVCCQNSVPYIDTMKKMQI